MISALENIQHLQHHFAFVCNNAQLDPRIFHEAIPLSVEHLEDTYLKQEKKDWFVIK